MLVKKDIEKKRQALEEEKNMISERLDKRKEAADEAEQYEELAELKRQYAMISMDSTRTKDAAELRDKIADIEKDRAWKLAENEAEAQEQAIDDQLEAYDQFSQIGDENLEYLLADAHNFATEVNEVLKSDQKDLFDWLKENVKEYAKSLQEAQFQMLWNWSDMYDKMYGITHVFWDYIDGKLMSMDEYLAFMRQSQDYINASDTNREVMEQEWRWKYQDYVSAYLTGAEWNHSDDSWLKYGTNGSTGNGGSGSGSAGTNTEEEEKKLGIIAQFILSNGSISPLANFALNHYASGGLVDFTGPAWVDGTPSKPEAFLSADDTAMIRSWLDAAKYVRVNPYRSNIDSAKFGGNNMSIGDVNITITEASFNDDADIEKVAQRVGDVFVKELSKQGFTTQNYAF